jgi:hypothetical protein
MDVKYVLAVDPGKTTGISFLSLNNEPALLSSGEYQPDEFARPVRDTFAWCAANNVEFDVVCERFIINAQTVRNSQAPFSLEQIGALKQIMRDHDVDPDTKLVFQSPSDAKKMFPNDALRKVGTWHVGGGGHANDSIRHGLLRLVKLGWKPIVLLQ